MNRSLVGRAALRPSALRVLARHRPAGPWVAWCVDHPDWMDWLRVGLATFGLLVLVGLTALIIHATSSWLLGGVLETVTVAVGLMALWASNVARNYCQEGLRWRRSKSGTSHSHWRPLDTPELRTLRTQCQAPELATALARWEHLGHPIRICDRVVLEQAERALMHQQGLVAGSPLFEAQALLQNSDLGGRAWAEHAADVLDAGLSTAVSEAPKRRRL
jgi:hypothetical protein